MHTQGIELARSLYRIPAVEALLLLALLVQIGLGFTLVVSRLRSGGQGGWGVLQMASGIVLALFILAHTGANLSARFVSGLDTNFFWPASTLVVDPINRYFYFHYAVPICALFAHLACALRFNNRPRSAWRLLAAGPVAALAIILPFSGMIYPFDLPDEYRAYLEAIATPR